MDELGGRVGWANWVGELGGRVKRASWGNSWAGKMGKLAGEQDGRVKWAD